MTADLLAVLREAFEAGYIQGHDATVEGRYADPSDAAQDYVRTLLAPAVDEAAPLTESAEAPVAWMRAAGVNPQFEPAVISATVKSIWLRVKPARVERYTVPLYTHPASTNTDAGVTEAQCYGWVVEWHAQGLVERHLYRTRDFAEGFANVLLALPSTQTDRHVRVVPVIEAALGAREGK